MAQQRGLSIGKDGCPSTPRLTDARIPDRENLSVHPVKTPVGNPFLNGSYSYPKCDQLAQPDNTVLSLGQPRNLPSHPGVSEFFHGMSWLRSDTPGVLPPVAGIRRPRRVARLAGDGLRHDFFRSRGAQRRHPAQGGCAGAAAVALAEDWEKALSYGTGIGHPGLCQWIAERHGGLDASQVMVANGSLEAGWMLFEHLLEAGDRVVVEQPTYDRTLLMLQRLGVELVPVALEADGLDIAAFEAALAEGPIKLAHVIPNFHNPAGCTLSAEKRVRLVELAAEHGFWIFEDDPYRELPFEGEALETMLSLDKAGRVVHASSFSKTVSPGVRVGYLAGPAEEIAKLAKRANETYISPNMLAEASRAGALPLRGPRPQHRVRQGRAARPARRAGRGSVRADPRGRVRRPRRRLLPLARPGRGHRHQRPCSPRPRARASPSSPARTS